MNNNNIVCNPESINQKILFEYKKTIAKKVFFMGFMIVSIIMLGLFALTLGPMDLTIKDPYQVILHKIFPRLIDSPGESIEGAVWLARVPRLLTGLVAGFGLAVAGAVMQPVLRNPMASPFTLGISSGAGFGAALAIILGKSIGGGSYFVVANAFLFSLLTSCIILLLAKKKGSTPETMILTGIALSYFFSACITILEIFADPLRVTEVVFWMVGSLSKGTWETLEHMFPIVFVCVLFLIIKSSDLNSIGAGDDAAKSLGVNVEKTRMILMIVSSLVTAAIICFTGTIGFICLVAPHITRLIVGGDNRFVVPASGFVGAFLLVASDVVAMNILAPIILPIGSVTSFMGVPLFIYLIIKMKGGYFH